MSSVPFLVQFQFHSEQSETTPTHPLCLSLISLIITNHAHITSLSPLTTHVSSSDDGSRGLLHHLARFAMLPGTPPAPTVRESTQVQLHGNTRGCSISVIFGRGLTSGWSHQRLSSSRRLFPDTPCGKVCIASPQSSCSMCRYLETTGHRPCHLKSSIPKSHFQRCTASASII